MNSVNKSLTELNNAVLDLQTADFNSFERPLVRISYLLNSEPLEEYAQALKQDVDLEKFLEGGYRAGSMVGAGKLNWPEDRTAQLGLEIAIIEKGASDPRWLTDFAAEYFYGNSTKIMASIRSFISALVIPLNRDFKEFVKSKETEIPKREEVKSSTTSQKIFIVHGHDEAPRETMARFIAKLGFEPIILNEQANRGQTVPEKLSAYADVGFAVVLLTPDDLGRSVIDGTDQPRARQNVILELGYFIGKLGREKVCAFMKNKVEIPSDYLNVVYQPFDPGGAWKLTLTRELKAAGYEVDWNVVMG